MRNQGKRFEEDFYQAANKAIFIERLKDPGSSFNQGCQGCKKLKTRFSPKNLCDFFAFSNGVLFLLELKSHAGKSVPFDAIVRKETDKRLEQMVDAEIWPGIQSFIIFNMRDCGNRTFIVPAVEVWRYIQESDRKSIPVSFMSEFFGLPHKLKRVRYSYDVSIFLNGRIE